MRVLAALVLAVSISSSGCAGVGQGCPAALLSGQLVEIDGALTVKAPNGEMIAVDWSNYSLRREGEDLVVTDVWGTVLAREGDDVALGGGFLPNDVAFKVCGQVKVVS